MATAKKTYQEPNVKPTKKPTKVYQEKKLGWIDRLAIYFANRMDDADLTKFPPVSNIRRMAAYFIDFMLSNLLVCIPLTFIQSVVTGNVYATQDLRVVSLPVAYLIVACAIIIYILYFVYIPWKKWPGQTPGKRLLGYKICMMDDSELTFKALFVRNCLVLVFIEGAAMFITSYILQLGFLTAGIDVVPEWISKVYYFTTFLSVMVTLTNPHRRMFHDLIAKTKTYKLDETQETYHTF